MATFFTLATRNSAEGTEALIVRTVSDSRGAEASVHKFRCT